jgi:hypothetical protein
VRVRVLFFAFALAANCQLPAFAKEHPFPPQILSAKTISIVSNCGLVPSAHNPLKGSKFKRDAEAVLCKTSFSAGVM